jgi:hypothetical protein
VKMNVSEDEKYFGDEKYFASADECDSKTLK